MVDARSPIIGDWVGYFGALRDIEVHVVSTYPAHAGLSKIDSYSEMPVAFARVVGAGPEGLTWTGESDRPAPARIRLRGSQLSNVFSSMRRQIGPLTLPLSYRRLRTAVKEIRPDLVHAMRIPMEGLFASGALKDIDVPLVVSVWGNDFTLHGTKSPVIRRMTRSSLGRANGLIADCGRDIRLAHAHGYPENGPTLQVPGNGGIDFARFFAGPANETLREELGIPEGVKVIANLRGVREYVATESFFAAMRRVLDARDDVWFVATGVLGNARYESLADELRIRRRLRMLGTVSRETVSDLYRLADVAVSPSLHDGTPNSLLEAMACGSFPVVGDIETMYEWLEDGKTAIFVDPREPSSIASGILLALGADTLRERAAKRNIARVARDADFTTCMANVRTFYEGLARC